MTEDIVERLREPHYWPDHDTLVMSEGARENIKTMNANALDAATTIESLRAQLADVREKVKPIEGDDLREAICNSIPYVNTNVVQAAIDGDFSSSPQWIWRNHENGVVGFGRWPDNPDAAPYIRADLICAALARMSTSHALGFKAGIEAAKEAIAAVTLPAPVDDDWPEDEDVVGALVRGVSLADEAVKAITSLPTPPSPLPEILEAMQPFARAAQLLQPRGPEDFDIRIYSPAAGDEYSLSGDHLRAIAAVFTKLGGKIDAG